MYRRIPAAMIPLLLLCMAAQAAEDPAAPLGAVEASLAEGVLELIQSPRPRDSAWGAHYAEKHRVRAAAPLLFSLVNIYFLLLCLPLEIQDGEQHCIPPPILEVFILAQSPFKLHPQLLQYSR